MTSSISNLSDLLSSKVIKTNRVIEDNLASTKTPIVGEIASHLIKSGGKRIRPILTLAVSNLFGSKGDNDTFLAAAIEYIHSATLLHDDVVDKSEKRRGKKTANLVWTNKHAVLVGDFLFSRAFQLMVKTESLKIMKTLSDASSVISQGEILQLGIEKNIDAPEDTYMEVIKGKTSALFAAACQSGAEISEASDASATALREYGWCLGTSFQLIDDYLDYENTASNIGKNKGDDFYEKKITLPLLYAYKSCSIAEKVLIKELFQKPETNQEDLGNILDIMQRTGSLQFTKEAALGWTKKATKALSSIADSRIKKLLISLAEEIVERDS